MPVGHFIGAFKAIHLITVRETGVAMEDAAFLPMIARNASLR